MYYNHATHARRGSLLRDFSSRLQVHVERRFKPVTADSRGRETAYKNAVALAAFGAKRDLMKSLVDVLRTPLVSILECAEAMEQRNRGENVADYADLAKYIGDASDTLRETVASVLDMAQVEIGRYDAVDVEFDVADAINSTILIFHAYAHAAGVTLRSELAPALPRLFADIRAFKLALATLICRAIQAANEIGAQVIVLTRQTAERTLAFSVACAWPQDHAEAPAEAEAPAASKEESRADQMLVENLVGMSGGSVHMQSSGPVGTVVTIVFPESRLRPDAPAGASRGEAGHAGSANAGGPNTAA
jgi:signal transduction histidine kinase